MWKVVVKTKHTELLGDRKIFTSQMGYDIEETIDGFVAKRNGETIATYRILNEER